MGLRLSRTASSRQAIVRSRLDNEKNLVELLKSGSIVNCRYRARSWKRKNCWSLRRTFIVVAALMSVSALLAISQNSSSPRVGRLTIQGEVLDSSARPVVGASVLLQQKGGAGTVETRTDSAGAFGFSGLPSGIYTLLAEESDLRSRADVVLSGLGGDRKNIQLVLEPGGPARPISHIAPPPSADPMEFSDAPEFPYHRRSHRLDSCWWPWIGLNSANQRSPGSGNAHTEARF